MRQQHGESLCEWSARREAAATVPRAAHLMGLMGAGRSAATRATMARTTGVLTDSGVA